MQLDTIFTKIKKSTFTILLPTSICLILAALIAYELVHSYDFEITAAKNRNSSIASLAVSRLENTLQGIDFIMRDVHDHVTAKQLAFAEGPTGLETRQLNQLLLRKISTHPWLFGIGIMNQKGIFVGSVNRKEPQDVGADFSYREYFSYLAENTNEEYHCSGVFEETESKEVWIAFSRTIHLADDKKFNGVIFTGLPGKAFRDIIDASTFTEGGSIAAFDRDGRLLFRYPPLPEKEGIKIADPNLERFLSGSQTSAIYVGTSPPDGQEKIMAFEKLGDFPYLLVVSSSLSADLSSWYLKSVVYTLGWFTITALTFMLAILLGRLSVAKEHLELIFNTSPYASLITRLADGVIVNINAGFTALTGFTRDDSIGKSSLDINIWKNPADRQKAFDNVREKGFCENFEAIFQRKDGSQLTGMMSAKKLTLQGVPHIVSVTHDISDRKQAEEALRWSETQLQAILESTADGILAVDNKGKVIKTNRRFVDFWRIPQSVMDSGDDRVLLDFVMNLLSDPEAFLNKVRLLYASDAVNTDTLAFKDGRVFDRYSFPMIMEGVVIGRVWSFRDITNRRQMEEALRESENRYRELSIVDDLTQLYNSRHFYQQLRMEIDRADRYGQPLTLLLLDIDDFKAFNDNCGHVEGDGVLSRLGRVVKGCLRQTDSAYRYGGEEFTVLLPMTTSVEGAVTAERIRMEFKKEHFSPAPGQEAHVTVSIGLAQYKPQEDMKAFVHRVDQLMYQGKKNGKDRVCSEP